MKKLLKILFITTMTTIPLTSSAVLAACSFSMGDTAITIMGISNNSIYIDAQNPDDIPEDWEVSSPRTKSEVVDIDVKNPMKDYKIVPTISNNTIKVNDGEGGEKSVQLIKVIERTNQPGSGSVSFTITSNTYISKDIESATINFIYFNEKTNSTIIPDIKNKSINVQVHQVEVREPYNVPIDITNKLGIQNSEYDFEDPKAIVKKETFFNEYIVKIIYERINRLDDKQLDFVLNENYEIFLNNEIKFEEGSEETNDILESFYNFGNGENKEIKVTIKSTDVLSNKKYKVVGEYSYSIKHNNDAGIAPGVPGDPSPGEAISYDLSEIEFKTFTYNFKDTIDEYKNSFKENYVKKFVDEKIKSSTSSIVNSEENYIVTLNNGDVKYNKNYWDDPEQQTVANYFLNRQEDQESIPPKEQDEKYKNISFSISPRDNQNGDVKVENSTTLSFKHDDMAYTAPEYPGSEASEDWIDIRFNAMFNGAEIDLSGMGGNNTSTTILKEGLGGLILKTPIQLGTTADIKHSVQKGFDVFHGEITKDSIIQKHVMETPIGNPNFDDNITLKNDFVKIIKDKSNWTINWWKHMGEVGTQKPDEDIPENAKENLMSTISYALTVDAKNKLEELGIKAWTDSFQFPMYVITKKDPTLEWNNYFGSKGFKDYYVENKMGLILGNTNDYVTSTPGDVFDDPDVEFEKSTYDTILTQQALGTFDENGIPGNDQNFYLTSGADYSISAKNKESKKHFNIVLEKSDNFRKTIEIQDVKNIRSIYGNDIVKEIVMAWSRYRFSPAYTGGEIPESITADFVPKKIKVKYEGLSTPTSAVAYEIGETLADSSDGSLIENAYLLDLTSESGFVYDKGGWTGIGFANPNAPELTPFYKSLLGPKGTIEPSDFLDEKDPTKVGISEIQEKNWLIWNVYNQIHKKRESATIENLQESSEKNKIVDKDNPPLEGVSYIYYNMAELTGGSSELSDKSIRHIVIRVNNK